MGYKSIFRKSPFHKAVQSKFVQANVVIGKQTYILIDRQIYSLIHTISAVDIVPKLHGL